MESCGTGSALGCRQKPEGSCPQLILGSCVLMALGGSLLGQEFEQKWWSYLCSQECPHFWGDQLFPRHRISYWCRQNPSVIVYGIFFSELQLKAQ